jgi:hypothetical protein
MKLSIRIDKLLAAVVMGLLFGAYLHHDYTKWQDLGREAFLSKQEYRFDHFMAQPRWFLLLFAGTLLAFIVLGAYEAIGAVLNRILPKNADRL